MKVGAHSKLDGPLGASKTPRPHATGHGKPLQTACRTVAVDQIAMRHTAKFADEKWAFTCVAGVRGLKLTLRPANDSASVTAADSRTRPDDQNSVLT